MTASFDCLKSARSALSVTVGKAADYGGLEEVAVAVDLLDGDLGVDLRRIVEVLPCFGEHCGHRFLPRDQVSQSFLGWCERALDHDVGGVGNTAAVGIGIARPGPDGLERQDASVDGQEHLLAVELIARRQRRGESIAAARSRNVRKAATSAATACCDGSPSRSSYL